MLLFFAGRDFQTEYKNKVYYGLFIKSFWNTIDHHSFYCFLWALPAKGKADHDYKRDRISFFRLCAD